MPERDVADPATDHPAGRTSLRQAALLLGWQLPSADELAWLERFHDRRPGPVRLILALAAVVVFSGLTRTGGAGLGWDLAVAVAVLEAFIASTTRYAGGLLGAAPDERSAVASQRWANMRSGALMLVAATLLVAAVGRIPD